MACSALFGDLKEWVQVLLNSLGLLIGSIVVNGEDGDRGLAQLVGQNPGLRWQVAVAKDTLLGTNKLAVLPDKQARSLVELKVWRDRLWAGQASENPLRVNTVGGDWWQVDVDSSGKRQQARVVLLGLKQDLDELNNLLGIHVWSEVGLVNLGCIILEERVVTVRTGESNTWNASSDGSVSGTNGTRQGVHTWRQVGTLVWTSNNQVNSLVVEVLWNDVLQTKSNTGGWSTVEVPDVKVVLLVVPRWSTSSWVGELTVGGQVDSWWKTELTTETRSLGNWGNQDHIVSDSLQLSVGGTDVGSSPSVIIGKQDSLVVHVLGAVVGFSLEESREGIDSCQGSETRDDS